MKKILNIFLIIVLFIFLFNFKIHIKAASADVYNIVTCPGEDMATQMRINWQSKETISNLKVEYTLASDTNFSNSIIIDGEFTSFSRQNNEPFEGTIYVGFSTPRYVWNASLDN